MRNFQALGYTYPEFAGLDMNNKQAVSKSISQKVAQLYGPKRGRRSLEDIPHIGDVHAHANSRRHRQLAQRSRLDQMWKGKFSDWSARIAFKRHELGRSFSVCLFLGDVPEDPNEWLVSKNLVGARHAFVHGMGNQGGDDVVEEGFIPFNPWLAEYTGLPSFAADLVAPFLTQKLQWRVIQVSFL